MRVLITGAGGMLGTDLRKVLGSICSEEDMVLTDVVGEMRHLDITSTRDVLTTWEECRPDIVVHAAAFTDVDGCERDPDKAYLVNALGTWNIAAACRKFDSTLVYISTDFVFDGASGRAYTEYDVPNPLGHYGASKLAGETHIRTLCPNHFIVRTAWLYGENGRNFPYTILKAAESRKELMVVGDQIGSPTFTVDLAEMVVKLISSPLYGTYHVTNAGACSWYDFACRILSLAGIDDVEVRPIASEDWPSPTTRPKYSVLRHYSLELQGKDDLRPWEQALSDFMSRIR